jgi:hypothetical protein
MAAVLAELVFFVLLMEPLADETTLVPDLVRIILPLAVDTDFTPKTISKLFYH